MISFVKTDIIKRVRELCSEYSLNPNDLIVIMGGALVMQGVRYETTDIDISCNKSSFQKLLSYGHLIRESRSGYKKISIDSVSLYEEWPVYNAIQIEGITVASLDVVVNDKRIFARKKDFEDIASIKSARSSDVEFFEVYSFPNYLRGLLHKGSSERICIMIHGYFSSNKIGINSLYFKVAEALRSQGVSALRIDLSGMGESEGDFDTLSFNQHVSDLYTIINELKNRGYKKISLIGHCEGCFPAIKILDYISDIESITLVSPVFVVQSTLECFFEKEGYDELMRNGQVYRKGLLCNRDFFDLNYLFLDDNYSEKIKKTRSTVIFAGNDEFSDNEKELKWAKSNSVPFEIVERADHNYRSKECRARLIEIILKNVMEVSIYEN